MFDFCINILCILQRQYKTIDTNFMLLFYIQLALFSLFIGNICKLILSLIIKNK